MKFARSCTTVKPRHPHPALGASVEQGWLGLAALRCVALRCVCVALLLLFLWVRSGSGSGVVRSGLL